MKTLASKSGGILSTTMFLQGGLGNQLFQLAAGELLHERGVRVVYDDLLLRKTPAGTTTRNLAVSELLLPHELVRSQLPRTSLLRLQLANRLKYGIIEQDGTEWRRLTTQRLTFGGVLGYFQDPVLVRQVWPSMRERMQSTPKWRSLLSAEKANRIAIHCRIGDYRLLPGHGVLSTGYYERALRNILERHGTKTAVLVSDDIDEARVQLEPVCDELGVQLEDYQGESELDDLKVISTSQQIIVANSSFSWWGAWLASDNGAHVHVPEPWFRSFNSVLGAVEEWTKVPSAFR